MMKPIKFTTVLLGLGLSPLFSFSQYAPGVGQAGTTAIYKDSTVFVAWASSCKVQRGYQDISNPSLGYASAGDSSMVTGMAQSNGVLSLGDGGSAICTFAYPVKNGTGPDFAVFENSFDDSFLELALVEVSSDGINFTRFKAHSLNDTSIQTGSFGSTDPTKLNNLAGKYRGGYGTPFDLQELAGTPGLNIDAITHIKIKDVVGSVNKAYASYDGFGNKINDPWPTAFPSGGFDLDAIGVIHQNKPVGLKQNDALHTISVYPNPVDRDGQINLQANTEINQLELFDSLGQLLRVSTGKEMSVSGVRPGTYFVRVFTPNAVLTKHVIIQ